MNICLRIKYIIGLIIDILKGPPNEEIWQTKQKELVKERAERKSGCKIITNEELEARRKLMSNYTFGGK